MNEARSHVTNGVKDACKNMKVIEGILNRNDIKALISTKFTLTKGETAVVEIGNELSSWSS